jgi:hypothetical protein
MVVLRAMAMRSPGTNWYGLADREIANYLQGSGASMQNLHEAIGLEAETSEDNVTFWTMMHELASKLPRRR